MGGAGVPCPVAMPLGLPDVRQAPLPGAITALIFVTTSLSPILCESHVFLASHVTKVINREDLTFDAGHVITHTVYCCEVLPFCNSRR